jgi:hypothetical protein
MRFISPLLISIVLGACATTPAPTTAPPPSAESPAVAPSRAAQLLDAAGRADAPTQAEIERVLGHADIARQDGAGAALTYRFEHCGLLLLFESDAHNTLRLKETHPSPRRAGEATPSVEQCAAEAPAR